MKVTKSSWSSQSKHKSLRICINKQYLFTQMLFRVFLCVCISLCTFSFSFAQDPNYVETIIYNVNADGNNVTSRSYSDGLGRQVQSQTRINGSANKVIVSGTLYDEAGRPIKFTKPFAYTKSSDNLDYINGDLIVSANSYYNGGSADRPSANGYAYSETQYYDDPLGRVKATGAPGKQFSTDGTYGHPVKTWYFGVTGTNEPSTYFGSDGFIQNSCLTLANFSANLETNIPNALNGTLTNPIAYYLTVTMDPNGHFSQELKDLFGRTISTWSIANGTDGPIVSEYSYDILGNLLVQTPPPVSPGVSPTSMTYNLLGQLTAKVTPDGGRVDYTYDDAGRLVTVSNAKGKVLLKTITYAYDDLDRVLTISELPQGHTNPDVRVRNLYDVPQDVLPYLQSTLFIEAGANNILADLANTNGRMVASIAYDDAYDASLPEGTYANKVIDLYSYDDEGRVSSKYKSIPGLPLQKINYFYDRQGKLTYEEHRYHYQGYAAGQWTIDIGDGIRNDYDPNGRLSSIFPAVPLIGGGQEEYRFVWYLYSDLGLLQHKIFVNKMSTTYTQDYVYNIRDWMVNNTLFHNHEFMEQLYYDDLGGGTGTSQYNGNISRATVKTVFTGSSAYGGADLNLSYTYDMANRLNAIDNYNTTYSDYADYGASFTYHNDGRFKYKNEGTAQSSWKDYVYNTNTNQLVGITSSGTKVGTITDPNYVYDPNGNMVFDRSKMLAIEYDWRDMPVRFYKYSALPAGITTWAAVRGLSSNSAAVLDSEAVMTYDASGNRVKKEVFDYQQACTPPTSLDPGLLISYVPPGTTTPQAMLLISPSGDLKTCLRISNTGGTVPVPLDALVIEDKSTSKVMAVFTQNEVQFGVPVTTGSMSNVDIGSFILYYTTQGTMTLNTYGGYAKFAGSLPESALPTTGVGYCGGGAVFLKNSGISPYEFSYLNIGGEGKVVLDPSSPWNSPFYFYVKDHLGSTRAVLEEHFDVQEATAYLAYGTEKPLMVAPVDAKAREKFTGKELDEKVGMNLNYFGARYYDPEIGSFVNADRANAFWNSYSYCGGNPVLFLDPLGNDLFPANGEDFTEDEMAMYDEMVDNGYYWMIEAATFGSEKTYMMSDLYTAYSNAVMIGFYSANLPNTDYGISEMKDVTGYMNNVAWLIPPLKIPVMIANVGFTVGDWAMKYHQTGNIPWGTIGLDVASYSIGKITGANAKQTLGTVGEEVISNAMSRGWDETSKAIMNASRRQGQ